MSIAKTSNLGREENGLVGGHHIKGSLDPRQEDIAVLLPLRRLLSAVICEQTVRKHQHNVYSPTILSSLFPLGWTRALRKRQGGCTRPASMSTGAGK